MKSVMNHSFSNVPSVEIPRSTFDRSHGYKTTFDAGYLIPIYIDEVLPGDTHQVSMTGFGRLSTPVYPIMDNLILDTFFFFVPNRIVWTNWNKFCGEQEDPGDSIAYSIPVVPTAAAGYNNQTLHDYMGIPTKIASSFNINVLPFRGYNLIYNEWFRDQNLINSVAFAKGDGPDTETWYRLLRRCKRHDYFTSALPFLQKGDAVELPLGSTAPVLPEASPNHKPEFTMNSITGIKLTNAGGTTIESDSAPGGINPDLEWDDPNLYTDLASATAATVNEMRQAFQVQRLLERDARSGTRYSEIVRSHYGVQMPDITYRPVYLGGGSQPINVSPVARTDSSPGVLGAMGTVGFRNHGFVQSFTEHGYVIGLACVRADLTYQEGLDRHWSRETRYDMYWPSLAHLGEQSIKNQEIYLDAAMIAAGTEDDVFGYQERWAEYRYKPSKVTGKFRSNDAATLDAWHLGIEFGALPTLDDTFIVEDPPVDRVIATPTEPHFIFDSFFNVKSTRPMPMYSIPGLIDHF